MVGGGGLNEIGRIEWCNVRVLPCGLGGVLVLCLVLVLVCLSASSVVPISRDVETVLCLLF